MMTATYDWQVMRLAIHESGHYIIYTKIDIISIQKYNTFAQDWWLWNIDLSKSKIIWLCYMWMGVSEYK